MKPQVVTTTSSSAASRPVPHSRLASSASETITADRQPAAESVDPDRLIKPEAVRHLCGGISDMTIWRWLQDPEVGFPRPVYIARQRYWVYAEIRAWLAGQREARKPAAE